MDGEIPAAWLAAAIDAYFALWRGSGSGGDADAFAANYADAQLEALKKAMLGVAFLALLSSLFTSCCRANRRQ